MPELPEVETIRRQLAAALVGARLVAGEAHPSPKFVVAPTAVGARIEGVARRGKYLLVGLDDERELVVHLGMTGGLSVWDPRSFRADPYTRAWWLLDDGRTLAFRDVRRFGRIAVVPAGDHRSLPTLAALGPEPFSDEFTPVGLHRALGRSRTRLKTQLLSQRPVAGVGNIYADEALWHAAVDPGSRTITGPQAHRLHGAIRRVLQQGIDHGGTTLRDYRAVDGRSGDNQVHLVCYGRSGHPCARCGTLLQRLVLDGRSTTRCPRCQRR